MNYFKRHKFLKSSPKSSPKSSQAPRESGHYWVQWSGPHLRTEAWRLASYWKERDAWKIMGDEREYYDKDFIKINENRIPFTTGRLFTGFWHWVAVIANLSFAAYYIFYLLTHR